MRYFFLALTLFSFANAIGQRQTTVTLYFELATTTLTPESEAELANLLAAVKREKPSAIQISGHADKTGSDEINDRLSNSRAMYILKALEQIAPNAKHSVMSYGASRPVSLNENEQHKNRRVDIVMQLPDPSPEDIMLEPYREDVEEQRFEIDLDDTVRIYGKEGTFIKISPGSMAFRSGEAATGKATLVLKEYYRPAHIILAGLHTASREKLLQTGGMFYLCIIKKTDTLSSETKKPFEIRMPVLNERLRNMSVFSMPDDTDSSTWQKTSNSFDFVVGGWFFPRTPPLHEMLFRSGGYTEMSIGAISLEEGEVSEPIFPLYASRPYSKRYSMTIKKVDSSTLQVNTKIRFRNRGLRAFGQRKLDTTYFVNYVRPIYMSVTRRMSWINCDVFYDIENPVDFYVQTPGFRDMTVMIYFKTLNSFLPVGSTVENGAIPVSRVPENMPIVVVAMGRKDGEIYFGKQELLIRKNATVSLQIDKKSETEISMELSSLK